MLMIDFIKGEAALLAWREERSNGIAGMTAVLFVLRNRVNGKWFGGSWLRNITQHGQFSSMTIKGDAGTVTYPDEHDPQFQELLQHIDGIFDGTTPDSLTNQATYYADMGSPGYDQHGWFARNIAPAYPIVAKVGSTTYFGRPGSPPSGAH